jgi:UDP-N-acetylmuramoyl-tripeptide--D-alanyl-D-alanine ligase
MRLIAGLGGTMLLDDTYNSSPVACEDALKTLAELPRTGKRIAVLGDMLELGPYSVSEHERIGAQVPTYTDLLVTVGMRARKIAERAKEVMGEDRVFQFDRALDAAEHIKTIIEKGDIILLKGSQGIRLERAVKELMGSPEFAKDLLCRQDAEWLTR